MNVSSSTVPPTALTLSPAGVAAAEGASLNVRINLDGLDIDPRLTLIRFVARGGKYFVGVLVLDHDDNEFEMHGLSSLQDSSSESVRRLRLVFHSLICA